MRKKIRSYDKNSYLNKRLMSDFVEKKRRFFNQMRKCEKNSSKKAPQILNFFIFLGFLTLK